MATIEHPHIVQFVGVAYESLSDLFCVSEFMAGGDLRSLLKEYLAARGWMPARCGSPTKWPMR
ncbi:hypothetical protein PF008_g26664 [Phytophthora fragariae]|uniref:Protein kinase domain-containing protein n=1 Tax=Phytophthora fragariae TaxID=53985 RepID=A0A6G0QHA3_9STRA|nr:hypothetical protein PF008_g26664 [Phytophthora fragariae]